MARRTPKPIRDKVHGGLDGTAAIEKIVLSSESPIDLKEMACELIKLFGGPAGIARHIHNSYLDASRTPKEKSTIMNMVYKILANASRADVSVGDDATDEQLEFEAMRLLKKMNVKTRLEWMSHVCI